MGILIQAASATEAWVKASMHLRDHGDTFGVHVEIASPLAVDQLVVERLDQELISRGHITCKHVANTIFPMGLWRSLGLCSSDELFQAYNRAGGYYDRLKARRAISNHHDWGTYFQRMSSNAFGKDDSSQLSSAIRALGWTRKPKGAIHIHTAFPTDVIRPQGGPCLQMLTLHADANGQLLGLALYRNHDFFQKTLGNYIGIGQLLSFLAQQSGLRVGSLHVVSAHAYFGVSKPVHNVLSALNV